MISSKFSKSLRGTGDLMVLYGFFLSLKNSKNQQKIRKTSPSHEHPLTRTGALLTQQKIAILRVNFLY